MDKIDFKRDFRELFTAKQGAPKLVEVPPFTILRIDGEGDPNEPPFRQAVEALYSLAYALKFGVRQGKLVLASPGRDWAVPPLEGLWWHKSSPSEFSMDRKQDWRWRAFLIQPDFVTPVLVERARMQVEEKLAAKREANADERVATLKKVVVERFEEGLCAQVLHVGPYATEPATIQQLHGFIKENRLKLRGMHHEIYLGDPMKARPERLKTILRQPVSRP